MPELPEVETIARQLNARLAGHTLQNIDLWRSGREAPVGDLFVRSVLGRNILRVFRRAKLLVFLFSDGGAMTAHLKMTGRFTFVPATYVREKHDRIRFVFNDSVYLIWADVRQFGYLKLVSADELDEMLSAYGPEPLEHSIEVLAERFRAPVTRTIKTALLDQATLAGVGNIYADEACHRAGIRPTRRLKTLSNADRLRLVAEVKSVLEDSIAQKGTSANDYVDTDGTRGGFLELLRVYGREGEPCRTCKTPITKIVLAQRGTHYCSACQS